MDSPSESSERYLTPLRGLNEFVYCPRLFHLMYVQELFEESVDTVEGQIAHTKRLTQTKARSKMETDDEPAAPWNTGLVREMTLSSDQFGIVGKFDVIIEDSEGIVPVEVKHGPAPDGALPFRVGPYELPGRAWGNDQVQIAGQIALLQEAGYSCSKGRLYYQQTKTLVEVNADTILMSAMQWVAEQTQSAFKNPIPDPLEDSQKCIRCSLNHICLPDETLHLKGRIPEPRQLYPGRDDSGVLHLITPGTFLGKSGESVKVTVPGEKEVLIPIKDVAHVCCWGNAQISTQAVLELADRGIGITWLTSGGWLRAITSRPSEKCVRLRKAQYHQCDNLEVSLQFARWIVRAKIENQRVLIRRNVKDTPLDEVLHRLKIERERASEAESFDALRGIEGYAAKNYWDAFPSLLSKRAGKCLAMNGRSRRPPLDPINALLSFGYSMLLRDFVTSLHGCGLDPMCGFYHAIVPGRPALALDLMEAFRPLVVDSAVLRSVNEGRFTEDDFVQTKGFCTLKPQAKKRWIAAYERRVDEMVTHPVFGYRLSYRRVFTLESRLFGRCIAGEIAEYHPIVTR